MRDVVFVGTAVTRPDSVGALYRLRSDGGWDFAEGIPTDSSVQAITPHPTREGVIYAATQKGAYRSTDGGSTWHRLTVTTEPLQFWSIVVSPHDPDVLFTGTSPVGIFRSSDGGDTWTRCEANHPERFEMGSFVSRAMRIAFHPTDPKIMYAVAEINGLLVSEDGGLTWHGVPDGLLGLAERPDLQNTVVTKDGTEGVFDAHSVCTTVARPDALFYVGRMGIFESTDKGKTFRDMEVKNSSPFSYSRDCRFVCDDPTTMYACFSIESRSTAGALYRSEDLGENWTRVDSAVDPQSTIMGLGLHVNDPDGVVTMTRGGQVFFTTDGCRTWNERQLPADAGDAFCGAIL